MSEHVHVALEQGVLTVTLARPDKKNAITQAMYTVLAEATERAKTDPDVRVILFRAEGDSFCAGNDIGDFIAIGSQTDEPLDMSVFRFLKALAELDRPAVAAVRGRAVGIGLTLLLHCDMVVVADDALLSVPFVNLALAPEAASTALLPAVIGHQRAFELFALGEPITGRQALDWGLANRAVPAGQVDEEARRLAALLAARAPNSIRSTKRLMRDAEAIWALMLAEGEAFGAQMKSPEAMEAFMAFSQRRAPDFSRAG
ncbi:enoyl-CoA hydratase [Brevundimonas sp. BAL450]|jgi:enoyl-CoA hydratase/carnithine racemase|uniref:Enoyl-CoA hydratase n=1 Tax=Brevundimonas abyssalis TAR-001 TaxID=1391729 RepID=A0A8E0KJU5_9CAUL|nr:MULTISPECIES: enoyl-CoA hydratase [Brevundimonas]MBG7614784.1 enoyl-CoA hydratase [Brevundimonas sp. BAL450]GAD58414.1 enoyl-CoA hydratase [Brevundimonas abyssalis TAR-001]